MSAILPPHRPAQPREVTAELLLQRKVRTPLALLGVRGYFRDTMGAREKNDRGIYDDAIFLLSPSAYVAFNANTDPSAFRPRIATLQTGLWHYRIGTHGLSRPKSQQYRALVQAADVTVARDGAASESGRFGINIHRGGYGTTSSLGCQTIYPDQWPAFIGLVQAECKRWAQSVVPYLLIDHSA